MMTLGAQTENQNIETSSSLTKVNCNEKHYDFIAKESSEKYRAHLYGCLAEGEGIVISEIDFEDSNRYTDIVANKGVSNRQVSINPQISREYSQPKEKTVKTFDRKKTSILVMYAVMVLAIVVTLIIAVPGTAWENDSVSLPENNIPVAMASGSNLSVAEQGLNVVMTEQGPVTVELTPYEKKEEEHTNWFDKVCDWVSNIVGG